MAVANTFDSTIPQGVKTSKQGKMKNENIRLKKKLKVSSLCGERWDAMINRRVFSDELLCLDRMQHQLHR